MNNYIIVNTFVFKQQVQKGTKKRQGQWRKTSLTLAHTQTQAPVSCQTCKKERKKEKKKGQKGKTTHLPMHSNKQASHVLLTNTIVTCKKEEAQNSNQILPMSKEIFLKCLPRLPFFSAILYSMLNLSLTKLRKF